MTRNYRWTWNARIQKETLAALQTMAAGLGFVVTQASRYQGKPSPPDMLDALAAAYPDGGPLIVARCAEDVLAWFGRVAT